MRAIISTFDGDRDSLERLMRRAMNIVRQGAKTWIEDVGIICHRAKETTISDTFCILIKETTERKHNREHILAIYTLFVDVVTEIEAADEVVELNKLQDHLVKFYGNANPFRP